MRRDVPADKCAHKKRLPPCFNLYQHDFRSRASSNPLFICSKIALFVAVKLALLIFAMLALDCPAPNPVSGDHDTAFEADELVARAGCQVTGRTDGLNVYFFSPKVGQC